MRIDHNSKTALKHSIVSCHERRRIQALARGRSRQPERLIAVLLEDNHPPYMSDFDILSMAVRGQVFC